MALPFLLHSSLFSCALFVCWQLTGCFNNLSWLSSHLPLIRGVIFIRQECAYFWARDQLPPPMMCPVCTFPTGLPSPGQLSWGFSLSHYEALSPHCSLLLLLVELPESVFSTLNIIFCISRKRKGGKKETNSCVSPHHCVGLAGRLYISYIPLTLGGVDLKPLSVS